MKLVKLSSIVSILLAFAVRASAVGPEIIDYGPVQVLPGPAQYRASIDTDSANQPHIITTSGSSVYFYDFVGGNWRVEQMNSGVFGSTGQYGNPRLEIADDKAWYSGVLFGGTVGIGIVFRQNVTSPNITPVSVALKRNTRPSPGKWDNGELSVDPNKPNVAISSSMAGFNLPVTFTGNGLSVGARSQMFAGEGGEKNAFRISRAGNVAHANGSAGGGGSHAVWHGAIGGYPAYSSAYRNSRMGNPVAWAWAVTYPAQSDDGSYVNVCGDAVQAEVAYMVATYAGVNMNIWNGSKMLFPISGNLIVDPVGGTIARRYAPRLAPAKDGGVFVLYYRLGNLALRYVSPSGQLGNIVNLGPGFPGDINVDSQGNIHIVYVNGGNRYRKLTISGSGQGVVRAADFNNDGVDDLAAYDAENEDWTIKDTSGASLGNVSFGAENIVPIAGYFTDTNVATIGYYMPETSQWTVRSNFNNAGLALNNAAFGSADSIPVIGDFDGDGLDDLGLYNQVTFKWALRTVSGATISNNLLHGFSGGIPATGDFNGDGEDDLAIWNPADGKWYIRTVSGDPFSWGAISWGVGSMRPAIGDYNNDGVDDLGLYDASASRWYVYDIGSAGAILLGRQFGEASSLAVPGYYDGMTNKTKLATFQGSTGKFTVLLDDGVNIQPGLTAPAFGTPVPGDYNGDGTNTMAIYEESTGTWRIHNANGSVTTINFGNPGLKPVPGDYNNDGQDDLALYQASTGNWFIRTVAGAVLNWNFNWGFPGAVPVSGDFYNDGTHDLAIYHEASGRWYIRERTGAVRLNGGKHGFPGASAVSGDFDGDGFSDLAVVNRNSNPNKWYIMDADSGVFIWNKSFGYPGTRRVSGDFDNDGQDDMIIYDTATRAWYGSNDLGNNYQLFNAKWGFPGVTPFILEGQLGVLQQDRTWYLREDGSSVLAQDVASGQLNGIPIGTTSP